MMEEKREQRIKGWVAWMLVIMAFCVDLAELAITWLGAIVIGAILSEILSIVAAAAFWIIFQILGVSMSSNTKRFTISLSAFLIEIIPGFDAIPLLSWAWTAGMILTVVLTRMEDRGESFSVSGFLNEAASFTSPMGAVARKYDYEMFRKPPGVAIAENIGLSNKFAGKFLYKNKTEEHLSGKNGLISKEAQPKIPETNVLNLKKVA